MHLFPQGSVEHFTPIAKNCPRGETHQEVEGMFNTHALAEAWVPSSKATAILMHEAYMEYVSANAAKSGKSVSPKVGKIARTPLAPFFQRSPREKLWTSLFPLGMYE